MTPLFKKLNYKDQPAIFILHHPASFEPELAAMRKITTVKTATGTDTIAFILVFVLSTAEIEAVLPAISSNLEGDGVVWFAYPKLSSKKYKSEINRDKGWQMVGEAGFEPVRAVAIDEDWSGLRFRRVGFIKKMTRNHKMAMTHEGREKASGNRND